MWGLAHEYPNLITPLDFKFYIGSKTQQMCEVAIAFWQWNESASNINGINSIKSTLFRYFAILRRERNYFSSHIITIFIAS